MRIAGTVALGLGVAWLLLVAYDLWRIRSDVDAASAALDELTLDEVGDQGVDVLATEIAGRLDAAADRARTSPWLKTFAPLPILSDQLDGVRQLTAAAAEVGTVAQQEAKRLSDALGQAGEPAKRVALLDTALASTDRLDSAISEVDLGPVDRLLGPVADAHEELTDALGDARVELADGRELIAPVRELLAGPRSYLVLAGNNAEMTAGSGMPLSVGVATFSDGEIEMSEFTRSADHVLGPRRVEPPAGIGELYPLMGMGHDFRGTTASPNFPLTARLAAEMAPRADLGEVDGVLLIDVVALRAIVRATGPVEVEGISITADNIEQQLLNENYQRFDLGDRTERVELQGRIAQALFDALTERDVPVIELVSELLDSAEGRHLLAWSRDEQLQRVWTDLGLSGELHARALMISAQNYDANKLDWYLRPEASLDVHVAQGGDWRAQLSVSIGNPRLPAETGSYILGPTPEVHFVLLTVHLPAAAREITTTAPDGFRTAGEDGPMQVRTLVMEIEAGTTETRLVEFTLPREERAMLLLPSARVEPVPVVIDDTVTVTDAKPQLILWLAAFPPPDPGLHAAVRALVVAGALAFLVAALVLSRLALRRRRALALGGSWAASTTELWVTQTGALACLTALVAAAFAAVALG